ncbi:complement factor I-like isoform 2-T2 [Synchiropus picturatus]
MNSLYFLLPFLHTCISEMDIFQSRSPEQIPVALNFSAISQPSSPAINCSSEAEFLASNECRLTRESCDTVFCPPWQRCIQGRCACKLPYMCTTHNVKPVCGRDQTSYRSFCQAMAMSCRTKESVMSHFAETCQDNGPVFRTSIDPDTGLVTVFVPDSNSPGGGQNLLVCKRYWQMAEVNVACRENGSPLGGASAGYELYHSVTTQHQNKSFPKHCVSIRCQGYETSLAECVIHDKVWNEPNRKVATATCYNMTQQTEKCSFKCANEKLVPMSHTCDGIDHCGDLSDEMCCKKCRNKAFRCKTGVCVSQDALLDQQIDCLDGEDESKKQLKEPGPLSRLLRNTEYTSPRNETAVIRAHLESRLYCGLPNTTTVHNEEMVHRQSRFKRVVGGTPAKPTQIQWQVALQEDKKIDCGGAYIGGCWVLTAAHCVRPNPTLFWVKFSLWMKSRPQDTTDIVSVQEIIIHPQYDAATYQNDIALVKLKALPQDKEKCFVDNPAVSAVCVPWTTKLFQPSHNCSISGWGLNAEGDGAQVLHWAKVTLIDNCQTFYGDRFKPGMMCADDPEGRVDSCQWESGGPLVCEDELGVSYLWGIVTWGERCGQRTLPGLYTQVAHYFEWIRGHTGWPAVTKYNF